MAGQLISNHTSRWA